MRIDPRILIIQADHVADREKSVGDAIDPGASILFHGQRVTQGVNHFSLGHAACRNLPQLLDPHAIGLRVLRVFEVEALDQLLAA